MELADLVGEHILDAVDFSNEQLKREYSDEFETAQVMRFRLDGIVYAVVEDPDDGYRSSMQEIIVDESATMVNVFPPIKIVGRYRTETGDKCNRADILELIDVKTGKTVLEAGTDASDDYYPSYVASFHPEAMAVNAK